MIHWVDEVNYAGEISHRGGPQLFQVNRLKAWQTDEEEEVEEEDAHLGIDCAWSDSLGVHTATEENDKPFQSGRNNRSSK